MGNNKHHGAVRRGETLYYHADQLTLVTDRTHGLFRPSALFEPSPKLVKDIMQVRRLRVPIVLKKNGELLEICDGRSRYIAAVHCNKSLTDAGEPELELWCVLKNELSLDQAQDEGYKINTIRRTAGPIEMADDVAYLSAQGKSVADIADKLGVSNDTVKNYQKISECSNSVRDALDNGRVSLTIARDLSSLSRGDQDMALAKLLGGLGVASTLPPPPEVKVQAKKREKATKPKKAKGAAAARIVAGFKTKTKHPDGAHVVTNVLAEEASASLPKAKTETVVLKREGFAASPQTMRHFAELVAVRKRLDPEDSRLHFRLAAAFCDWLLGDDDALKGIGTGNLARVFAGQEEVSTEQFLDSLPSSTISGEVSTPKSGLNGHLRIVESASAEVEKSPGWDEEMPS